MTRQNPLKCCHRASWPAAFPCPYINSKSGRWSHALLEATSAAWRALRTLCRESLPRPSRQTPHSRRHECRLRPRRVSSSTHYPGCSESSSLIRCPGRTTPSSTPFLKRPPPSNTSPSTSTTMPEVKRRWITPSVPFPPLAASFLQASADGASLERSLLQHVDVDPRLGRPVNPHGETGGQDGGAEAVGDHHCGGDRPLVVIELALLISATWMYNRRTPGMNALPEGGWEAEQA